MPIIRRKREVSSGNTGVVGEVAASTQLVTIADEEVRIQLGQIDRDLSDPVGTVNDTQNPPSLADFRDGLERKPRRRHRRDGFKDTGADLQPVGFGGLDGTEQGRDDVVVGAWQGVVVDLSQRQVRAGLADRDERLLDRAVDGVEVDDAGVGPVQTQIA